MTVDNIILAGQSVFTGRESVRYAYRPTFNEPDITLGGKTFFYLGTSQIAAVTADLVGVGSTDYQALESIVAAPGAIPYKHGGLYFALERESLSETAYDPVLSVEWRVNPKIRLVDFWGYGATLEAATVWTSSPGVAYYQQNSGAQTISANTGLVFAGTGSWNTSLREKENRNDQEVTTLEVYCSIPVASEAAIGLMDLSASWSARPLGGNGTGVHFKNGTISFTTGADVLSGTIARAGGTYRIQIQDRGTSCRILVWENGTLLARTLDLASGATSAKRGAVFSAKSGSATLKRWWVGGF
jgi:hypothetical protein